MKNQEKLFERSKELVPGGVHSPVRSFKGLKSTPRFIKKAKGAYFKDTEGKQYIDFCMSFGPMILGHRNAEVEEALKEGLKRGWSYGACEPYSLELVEFLLEKLPFADKIRFVSSGTEAVMTALRLARGATGRNKIIKFEGCYHGHVDSMLIKAGSGLAGESTSSSAGVSENVAKETLILPLDNEDAVRECFKQHKDEIAAIIIEPLPANNGLLPQRPEYLQFLRDITKENGALLIFDEVISGFRAGFTGMAGQTGINPDIVTYGKVIGGGMPVGAIAGPSGVMDHLAPIGNVYQAGTLSANPLAMVGGLATLSQMTDKAYKKLEKLAARNEAIWTKWLAEYDNGKFSDIKFIRAHSLFWMVPGKNIRRADEIPSNLMEKFVPMFELLLEKGIYLAPNAYEVGFLSLAHDDKVLDDLEEKLWS